MVFETEKITPEHILTVYSNNYIEHRKIYQGKVLEGKPLTQKTAQSLFLGVNESIKFVTFKDFIPKNVLYAESGVQLRLAWVSPSREVELIMNNEKNSGKYIIPNLVFYIQGHSLRVAAYKILNMEHQLYEAPFPNISRGGVCMGSAKLQIDHMRYYEDIIDHAEYKFFNSKFSHGPTKTHLYHKGKKRVNYDKLEKLDINFKDFIHG